jgi:hypothetical protein
MSLDGGVWKIWREAPGFWQRYTGVITGDATTITGAWERSLDGREWHHDFSLSYLRTHRLRRPPTCGGRVSPPSARWRVLR